MLEGAVVIRIRGLAKSVAFWITRSRSEQRVLYILEYAEQRLAQWRVDQNARHRFWRYVEYLLRRRAISRMYYIDTSLNDLVAFALERIEMILEYDDEQIQKGEAQ